MSTPRIDEARLWAALEALGRIGAYRDERSGLDGVNRLALTAADGEGRRHVIARMRARSGSRSRSIASATPTAAAPGSRITSRR